MSGMEFLASKYFVTFLLIVIIVLLIICMKRSCSRENMTLLSSVTNKPWTNNMEGSKYRQIGEMDSVHRKKEKDSEECLVEDSEEETEEDVEEESEEEEDEESYIQKLYNRYMTMTRRRKQKKGGESRGSQYPQPMDPNPEYGNCPPCKPCKC